MTGAAAKPSFEFPSLGVLYDRAGLPVNASSWEWRLNDLTGRTNLNWKVYASLPPRIFEAVVRFVAHMVETHSPESVRNAFGYLQRIIDAPELYEAVKSGSDIQTSMFVRMRRELGKNAFVLHYVRHWYCWAADNGYEGFSADVAFEAEQMRVGGNEKGRSVRSMDPEEGPFDDLEIVALLNALRKATKEGLLSLSEQAAVWLCVAFGPNSIQPALMRVEDVKLIANDDGEVQFVHVDIPRMKKGGAGRRTAFRRRQVNEEFGRVLLALVAENKAIRELRKWPEEYALPLFVRDRPFEEFAKGPMREYALHMRSPEFTALLKRATDKIGVTSHRTGRPLKVTTRRLRYTFATRLVNEGVSKREIADLLDHSDLQHVQVYFDIKSDIVRHLDKAVALALAPVAQAFLGRIVGSENEAMRGGDPASRIAVFDSDSDAVRDVGNCGSFGFCGLMAPVACYTCGSFQPWKDGPHQILLERLLADRDRRIAAGGDGRFVSIHDATILAVADVITRIEAAREAAS